MNTLAQLMQQYDQLGLGAPTYDNSFGNGISSPGAVRVSDPNANDARYLWARAQMGGESAGGGQNGGSTNRMPDYFDANGQPNGGGYQPGVYREPQQSSQAPAAYGDGAGWHGGQYVGNQAPQRSMSSSQPNAVQNYLAMLLQKGPR